jgi:uncharacterized protein DUF7009
LFEERSVKLRIKGKSLRLRVARSELARLSAGERVEETIRFAPEPEAVLRYTLASDSEGDGVQVRYSPGEIAVIVSVDQMRSWSEESQVGIYARLLIRDAETLEISIEKDFACLDGSDQDNRDTFANPLEGRSC